MKSTTLKITVLAFAMALFSCNNNKSQTEEILEDVAEASEDAVTYSVDTDGSVIRWEGSKPGTTHYGHVKLSSGTLFFEDDQLKAGDFTIDMNTITDEDLEGEYKEGLEAHLKGTAEGKEGDFFNVKEFPHAKFELTGVEGNTIKGNLTIKDKTNPIEFPATIKMDDEQIIIETEKFDLDRTKWGINFMSKSIFSDLGDKFISDNMTLSLYIVAKK